MKRAEEQGGYGRNEMKRNNPYKSRDRESPLFTSRLGFGLGIGTVRRPRLSLVILGPVHMRRDFESHSNKWKSSWPHLRSHMRTMLPTQAPAILRNSCQLGSQYFKQYSIITCWEGLIESSSKSDHIKVNGEQALHIKHFDAIIDPTQVEII